jgi:hypothetical protein
VLVAAKTKMQRCGVLVRRDDVSHDFGRRQIFFTPLIHANLTFHLLLLCPFKFTLVPIHFLKLPLSVQTDSRFGGGRTTRRSSCVGERHGVHPCMFTPFTINCCLDPTLIMIRSSV